MTSPKVSIMIPAYNQAGFIDRAVRSALDQDHDHLEVVIADDCSTDATPRVVTDLLRDLDDPRVRYVRNETNLGILRNYHRNLIENATGDWAVNLDADDFFVDPGFVSKAIAAARRDPAIALVFADYAEVDEQTGERIDIRNAGHPEIMPDQDFLDRYADQRIVWNHNSILYDRHLAMQVGCYWQEGAVRNDWESFLRMTVGHKVAYVAGVAAAWVQHDRNETRRLDLAKYLDNFVMIDGVVDYAAERGLDRDFLRRWRRRMIAASARSSAVAYLRARDYRGLARFLRQVSMVMPGLPARLLVDPRLLARALLAGNPRLYTAAKRLVRR